MLTPHTISDLYQTIDLSHNGEIEFAILSVPDIHPQIPFKSPILRADYFSFILTTRGAGVYYLDDNKFAFGDQSLYFTNPGHTKAYELESSDEAHIIMVTESFLQKNVHSEIYGEFPFLLAEIVPPHEPKSQDFADYEQLFKQVLQEFNKDSPYRNQIVGNLLLILLLKIKDNFWMDYDPLAEGDNSSRIVKNFKLYLEQEFRTIIDGGQQPVKAQSQHFAKKMNLHPNYLNAVIKSKTGRTVQDWITRKTLSMAKSLLIDSTYSAKEIGYLLGYSESTHFGRFFKKHTNLTPTAFRKVNQTP